MRRALIVVAALVSALWAQSAPRVAGSSGQPPPRDQRPVVRGTSVIRGMVVDAESGQPIRRASVSAFISGVRLPDTQGLAAVSDAEGRFEIADLPAGEVHVEARHDAYYNPREDGAAAPTPKPYVLGAGQIVDGVRVTLRRTVAIAGRIMDEYGEPAIGVQVHAIRRADAAGRPSRGSGPGSFVTTDDTGAFRTWGLRPGRYLISADPGNRVIGAAWFGSTPRRDGHAPTYYPGTADSATASPVVVRAGQDTTGVVFALVPTRLASIRGTLLAPQGVSPRGLHVGVGRIDVLDGVRGMAGRSVEADGSFEITRLAPGTYRLTAEDVTQRDRVALMYGEMQVEVNGEDLDGVVLTMRRTGRITGRVVVDGGPLPPGTNATISARPPAAGGRSYGPFIRPVEAAPDGTFRIEGAYGRVRIDANLRARDRSTATATAPGPEWQLETIRADGRDITDDLVEVDDREMAVEIAFTAQVTRVAGTVSWSRSDPADERRPAIVIFPGDPARWPEPGRWILSTLAQEDGRFVVTGLPPGDHYLAAAVEGGWFQGLTSPAVLEALRGAATSFDLARGVVPELQLRAVPPPQP